MVCGRLNWRGLSREENEIELYFIELNGDEKSKQRRGSNAYISNRPHQVSTKSLPHNPTNVSAPILIPSSKYLVCGPLDGGFPNKTRQPGRFALQSFCIWQMRFQSYAFPRMVLAG